MSNKLFDRPFTFDRVIRIAITLFILWVILRAVGYLSSVLVPFVFSALVAYLIGPVVNWVQKYLKNRTLSVITTLVLLGGVFTGIFFLVIPLILQEINHMGNLLANVASDAQINKRIEELLPPDISTQIQTFIKDEKVQSFFSSEGFLKMVNQTMQTLLPGVVGVFQGAWQVVVFIFGLSVVLLYVIFILIDYNKVVKGWQALIPERFRDNIVAVTEDFEDAMSKYFRAQILIASIVAVMAAIGFYSIGLPLGIVLGIFFGMLNIIPYLQMVAIVPLSFMALINTLETGDSFLVMMGLIVLVIMLTQFIQDGILVPKIMGKVTGLNPAIQLLALSVWGKMLGILGLLIALPLTYLLYSYYRTFILNQEGGEETNLEKAQDKKSS